MISLHVICFQNPECMQMILPLPHLQKTHVSLKIKIMSYDMNLIQSWLSANKATDCVDGNGLKLEKIGQFFEVLMLHVQKILKKFIMVSLL